MAQTPRQKRIVGRVMHEFRHGELERSQGGKVRNPKQAIAIALREAGASNEASPAGNRRSRARTDARERTGETGRARDEATRAELYRRAREAGIAGRSRMSKAELQRALRS